MLVVSDKEPIFLPLVLGEDRFGRPIRSVNRNLTFIEKECLSHTRSHLTLEGIWKQIQSIF